VLIYMGIKHVQNAAYLYVALVFISL